MRSNIKPKYTFWKHFLIDCPKPNLIGIGMSGDRATVWYSRYFALKKLREAEIDVKWWQEILEQFD